MTSDFTYSVLVVDDEEAICDYFELVLEDYAVTTVQSLAAARSAVDARAFDLAILDKNLPDGTGLEVVQHMRELGHDTACLMVTAYANLESAIDAIRLNFVDYLEKPLPDVDTVLRTLDRIRHTLDLERQNRSLVAELQRKNHELEALATKDVLTGLFNHAYMQEVVVNELLRSRRHQVECSVLLVDLDNFGEVNERLGHAAGDKLLRIVSKMLAGQGRKTDVGFRTGGGDVAARYAGDEFALMLPETGKVGAAAHAERLRSYVESYDFSQHDLPPQTVSVGIATCPGDATRRGQLLECAAKALYAAKHMGRNRIVSYVSSMAQFGASEQAAVLEVRQQNALERTITEGRFYFAYQPIICARTNEVFAYEALARPTDGEFTNPHDLIRGAERTGKIVPLGRILRHRAVQALDVIPAPIKLFVNLHPRELYDPNLVVMEPFLKGRIGRLVFEITEVARLKRQDKVEALRERLRANGGLIALDDLGSGYSGLNSLAAMLPDFVKLDMGLVRRLAEDAGARRLVRHIIEFSRDEGLRVVAEGIETETERDIVTDLGADYLQGYLFGKPAPIEQYYPEAAANRTANQNQPTR